MKHNKYIYVYLDTRKPGTYTYGDLSFIFEPFYVGKGQGGRKNDHLSEAYTHRDVNVHKCNVIRRIKKETNQDPIILEIDINLTEQQALQLEVEYISTIGRWNRKMGPLTNQTDGGQTSPSAGQTFEETFGSKRAKEIRTKISSSKKGKKQTKEHKQKSALARTGVSRSDEAKQNISRALKGKPKSKEHKQSLKDGNTRRCDWLCTSPSGKEIVVSDLTVFCKEHQLVYREMLKISRRTDANKHIHRAKHHKGWSCKKLT